jgi:uncharacterized protein
MTSETMGPAGIPRFHLAIPVDDLDAARVFYGELLGCPQGRSSAAWVDWNLFGHQVVTHLVPTRQVVHRNAVDADEVPVPHFGIILSVEEFQLLAARLAARDITFVIEPHVRFAGEVGEQWTMFFLDPAGNPLEFKAFARDEQVFAH